MLPLKHATDQLKLFSCGRLSINWFFAFLLPVQSETVQISIFHVTHSVNLGAKTQLTGTVQHSNATNTTIKQKTTFMMLKTALSGNTQYLCIHCTHNSEYISLQTAVYKTLYKTLNYTHRHTTTTDIHNIYLVFSLYAVQWTCKAMVTCTK